MLHLIKGPKGHDIARVRKGRSIWRTPQGYSSRAKALQFLRAEMKDWGAKEVLLQDDTHKRSVVLKVTADHTELSPQRPGETYLQIMGKDDPLFNDPKKDYGRAL